ncbi:type VI secretion system baseplate subunit TssG [Dyadobacter sp. CY347]|uniref:type VI secretion system baseplate subunit TssG n=1 Tax=Dyadobacter sp. CY347 TaxID=2909336 RepID=UPI001F194433|nr:type VI secretion system baseplate subunit TssG [Dyadobacter sp. CY347]MCF2490473.1 type VI secretion system baseplate subunit TssG [Dyadobacter sp. CY347]
MIQEPKSDLQAEFVANSWLEEGLSPEKMLFRPLGSFKRRSHQDIEMTGEQDIGNFSGQVIESNRSGIYDYLPEQLFHLPTSNAINTLKKRVDEIRYQREKEQKSRLFFLPIEQEFFLNRLTISSLEQQAFGLDRDSALLEELRNFWQVPSVVSQETLVRLLPMLPFVSEHRGNMELAAEMLSGILNLRVEITQCFGQQYLADGNARLTSARLGMDTTLGGVLDTYLPKISIAIHVRTQEALEERLYNAHFDTFLNWLLGWFLPVEYEFNVEFRLPADASALYLVEEGKTASRLGFAVL